MLSRLRDLLRARRALNTLKEESVNFSWSKMLAKGGADALRTFIALVVAWLVSDTAPVTAVVGALQLPPESTQAVVVLVSMGLTMLNNWFKNSARN